MIGEPLVPLFDLVLCLSDAIDLVSPAVAQHHKQVAYLAQAIGEQMGLTRKERHDLVLSGMLHDAGALSLTERLDLLEFEARHPHHHGELGARMLARFSHLADVAPLVRFHHVPWAFGRGEQFGGQPVPLGAHVLHLADRVAVLIDRRRDVLVQAKEICTRISAERDRLFAPEVVDAFLDLAGREYIWLDATTQSLTPALRDATGTLVVELGVDDLLSATTLFRQVVDFRSRFTARHSAGVAASAEALAGLARFSDTERKLMRIAGHLHDLGKLAVPTEILEKPDKLTEEEFGVVRTHTFHTYFTYRTLQPVAGLGVVSAWAAFHHERLDGTGYPFHLTGADLPLGSRIMAVADVFTAITEDRPYRAGMTQEASLEVLRKMADRQALDGELVSVLGRHFEELNGVRAESQATSQEEYQQVVAEAPEVIPSGTRPPSA